MAVARLTTIPREPYTAHKVQGKPSFGNICHCANDKLTMLGLKMLLLFCTLYKRC